MSRKTIPFQIPQKAAADAASASTAKVAPMKGAGADHWVRQSETAPENLAGDIIAPAKKSGEALTITISAQPDWFDMWKLAFLPYATLGYWTLGAARKGAKGFGG